MTDLGESLRALYYAPLPLIVLNNNRTIKTLNQAAESILQVDDSTECIGKRLEFYLGDASRAAFASSINKSLQMAIEAPAGRGKPVSTRLQLRIDSTRHQYEFKSEEIWADVMISTWFPSDPDGSTPARNTMMKHESTSMDSSPTSSRFPHESLYTISIVPCPSTVAPTSSAPVLVDAETKLDPSTSSFKEAVFDNLDVAVLALSKDGKTEIRNKACIELLANLQESSSNTMNGQEKDSISQAQSTLTLYDEHFEKPFPESNWPIFQCALLGQTMKPVIVGSEVKSTGVRKLLKLVPCTVKKGGETQDNKEGNGHLGGFVRFRDVTAERLKLKEMSEQQSDLHFKQTVDTMPQLIWQSDASGYCNWYSNSFYEYTGLSFRQLQGTGWSEVIHPDDLAIAFRDWSESLRTGKILVCAFRIKRHDGVDRWFLCRSSPMRDSDSGKIVKWFGTNTDVHDQVEALAASQQAQAQLQSVISHAAVTLWATNREGFITLAEGQVARQHKLAMAASSGGKIQTGLVGLYFFDVWQLPELKGIMSRTLQGESVVSEIEYEGRWYRTSYSPLREQVTDSQLLYNAVMGRKVEEGAAALDGHQSLRPNSNQGGAGTVGEIIGVVGVSIDVTDRKQAQERMEQSTLEKTRALAAEVAAQEASRLKSQFLANMSHEIRTPISGIIGLSELLLDEKGLSPRHREYAETIERSAEGLLTVINDVLDFSKVEVGKLDVEEIPFNLVVMLGDLKRMLSFATQKKGLKFNEVIELVYRGNLIGDLGRLRQILTNLLTNAIKFTSQGHVSLEVRETREDDRGIWFRFDIKDTGCGIDATGLSQLFKPFSQADASTARRFGGTGLGLSISKSLVDLMGGKIGLNSKLEAGSHAWVEIPFRRATSAMTAVKKEEEAEGASPSSSSSSSSSFGSEGAKGMPNSMTMMNTLLRRPRKDIWILVAEDNEVNARIAYKNIERMGFSCQIAENGLLALEELKTKTYDVVLMDCQMPYCDGYEATRRLRKSSKVEIATIPVIALTASAIKGDRERALDAGMNDYLAKPVKRPALEATLCKWLYDHDTRQQLARHLV